MLIKAVELLLFSNLSCQANFKKIKDKNTIRRRKKRVIIGGMFYLQRPQKDNLGN